MIKNSLTLALTMGDPAGVGPEILLKSLAQPLYDTKTSLIVCGLVQVFTDRAKACDIQLELQANHEPVPTDLAAFVAGRWNCFLGSVAFEIWEPNEESAWASLDLHSHPIADLKDQVRRSREGSLPIVVGQVNAKNGLWAYLSIVLAHHLCVSGQAVAMVTAPIHKEALRAAGVPFIGHTEILGDLCGVADPLTMFETLGMRIFFHSRHVSLRKACDLITHDRVLNSLRRCHVAMEGLGLQTRRIAVAALNPHGGEHGLFGDEDDAQVAPAIAQAQKEGIDAWGPIGADSVFHQAKSGDWDAVLSLYHDQGHIAAKTLDFDRTIALTLGLPYLRTSVDHGTAMDIAGTGRARERSMQEAIKVAELYGKKVPPS